MTSPEMPQRPETPKASIPVPEKYALGDSLNWDAPWVTVRLWTELPFWLMVNDATIPIECEGHIFPVSINNNYFELFAGVTSDSRSTVVYRGPYKNRGDLPPDTKHAMEEHPEGPYMWRKCKTYLKIESRCNEDVWNAADHGEIRRSIEDLQDAAKRVAIRRSNESRLYLSELCRAHISVANNLIRSYRLATYDYFAFELSPWDVPHWWVERDGQAVSSTLVGYRGWDTKPLISKFNDPSVKPEVYQLIDADSLKSRAALVPTPGELELLDALNLMERGDYSGAVRRITTAIEVIVEGVSGKAMEAAKGKRAARRFLRRTRMRFDARVRAYQKLTGRETPEVLLKTLKETRGLRHQIVHAGYRIGPAERGRAQKAVDTGRWTFNWFENDQARRDVREKRIAYRSLGRDIEAGIFSPRITPDGALLSPLWSSFRAGSSAAKEPVDTRRNNGGSGRRESTTAPLAQATAPCIQPGSTAVDSEPTGVMTQAERLQKNELCDLLMKEGIEGRHDLDAAGRTQELTDLALELGRKDGLACALAWYDALEQRGISGEQAILLDYSRANAIAVERYGTDWGWEQPTLARELYYLRRATSHDEFAQTPDVIRCMCLNNLGNRLYVAGRIIEALDCWRRALEVDPNFGMSLCNRARTFAAYAGALDDPDERVMFLWMAHREASAALAETAVYTAARDEPNRVATKKLKEWVESVVDVQGVAAADPFASRETSSAPEESVYRQWCLSNCLYLNPLNDLGAYTVAATDSIGLGPHVVRVDAPYRFDSFFDQMMQEYVSARWLLYEGVTAREPHFSDKDVFLRATEPRPSLSLATEKIKAAYRGSYSLFDKVSFFINAYMELGPSGKQVSFRTVWRAGEKGPIRKEFDVKGNWGFCALYWLAKDLFEQANDEVSEPQARSLSDIMNRIERKYLRVTVAGSPPVPSADLALIVSRGQFEAKTLHVMKLARSALMYLAIGVRFEEQRRESGLNGVPLEEIPEVPYLRDDEKI